MEKAEPSQDLESSGVPRLWPVLSPTIHRFVQAGDIFFGWEEKEYRIYKENLWRIRNLARFPLTEQGWAQCWATLQTDYPELARTVANRASLEQRKAEQRAQRVSAEQRYRAELQSLEILTSVPKCILLGGHGYSEDLIPRTTVDLYFASEGLWVTRAGTGTPEIQCPYSEAAAIDFSGPGKITKGGGFFGGGFGVKGAVEGMAIAAVLNSITTKSEIRSVIRWEAQTMEAFFFTDTATPGDLRIQFSPVLSRIKRSAPQLVRPDDPLDRLERLAKLHQEGSLSDEEFSAMKRQLIGDV
jgi:hypothetical protein